MLTKEVNIKKLFRISGDLEKLAEKFVESSEDEESLRLYGTILDSAYKLRVAAVRISKDAKGQKQATA